MPMRFDHLAENTPAGGINAATRTRISLCEHGATHAHNGVACGLWITQGWVQS